MHGDGKRIVQVTCDPWMSEYLRCSVTLVWLDFNTFEKEMFGQWGEVFRKSPLRVEQFGLVTAYVVLISVVEWVDPFSEHHVEDHGAAPNIDSLGVGLRVELLRGHVDECPTLST